MQSYKRYRSHVFRFLLGGAIAAAIAVVFVGCTIERERDGRVRVRPDFGEDPSIGGVYREIEIGGDCYYSNGTWCMPCGGGELTRCSDLHRWDRAVDGLAESLAKGHIDGPTFVASMLAIDEPIDQDDQLEIDLQRELLALTGGLTGPEFLAVSGWPATEAENTTITSPLIIHLFTNDDGLDHVDVAFLWRTDWTQPELAAGVDVHMFIAGDVDDDDADLQVVRIAGDQASVAAALEPMRVAGSPVVVTRGNGDSYTF